MPSANAATAGKIAKSRHRRQSDGGRRRFQAHLVKKQTNANGELFCGPTVTQAVGRPLCEPSLHLSKDVDTDFDSEAEGEKLEVMAAAIAEAVKVASRTKKSSDKMQQLYQRHMQLVEKWCTLKKAHEQAKVVEEEARDACDEALKDALEAREAIHARLI